MNEVLMGIGEAAKIVSRTPNTIRGWEREGLIRPRRATTGDRIFSQEDIERLKRIASSRRNNKPYKVKGQENKGYVKT